MLQKRHRTKLALFLFEQSLNSNLLIVNIAVDKKRMYQTLINVEYCSGGVECFSSLNVIYFKVQEQYVFLSRLYFEVLHLQMLF